MKGDSCNLLTRPGLGFALLALVLVTKSAIAQAEQGTTPSLIKPADAAARMDAEQARETEAYTLGVQTALWGMQWVKAGQTLRVGAAPLPQGMERNPVDPSPHGINVWGHARGCSRMNSASSRRRTPKRFILTPS
jgi:hypothetical protein